VLYFLWLTERTAATSAAQFRHNRNGDTSRFRCHRHVPHNDGSLQGLPAGKMCLSLSQGLYRSPIIRWFKAHSDSYYISFVFVNLWSWVSTWVELKGELNLDNKWQSDYLFYIIMNEIHLHHCQWTCDTVERSVHR